MKWLTAKEAKEAAAKGAKAALDFAIKHWRQNATATFRECVAAKERGLTAEKLCALCYLGRNCNLCPIPKFTDGGVCYDTPYWEAQDDWSNFQYTPTKANYLLFHQAANNEYRFLLKVRKSLKAVK